jgi:hypothetical protein
MHVVARVVAFNPIDGIPERSAAANPVIGAGWDSPDAPGPPGRLGRSAAEGSDQLAARSWPRGPPPQWSNI